MELCRIHDHMSSGSDETMLMLACQVIYDDGIVIGDHGIRGEKSYTTNNERFILRRNPSPRVTCRRCLHNHQAISLDESLGRQNGKLGNVLDENMETE